MGMRTRSEPTPALLDRQRELICPELSGQLIYG
jgi:hypothetical protein